MAKKYRKKPVVIEAMQWDGTSEGAAPIIEWMSSHGGRVSHRCVNLNRCIDNDGDSPHFLAIKTLEGTMSASLHDWIIKGVQGEFYPCKPDIFEATYEAVEESYDW